MSGKKVSEYQPPFTKEIDLRGWQHCGQHDPSVHIVYLERDLTGPKRCRVLFHTQGLGNKVDGKQYASEVVTEVCRFGKNDCFEIFEGPHARIFVDTSQTTALRHDHEDVQAILKTSIPLHEWNPTPEEYKDWYDNYYKCAQGQRSESILAKFPADFKPSKRWFNWF